MNFRTLVALVALVAFIGSVQASFSLPAPQSTESQDINPRLLDQIVEAVAGQCDLTCCEVREAYAAGRMDVEKTENGYAVQLNSVDGNPVVIAILEDL